MKLLIFSLLLCLGASLKGQDSAKKTELYHVTISPGFAAGEVREVPATGVLDAITRIGLTVWTPKEWADMQAKIANYPGTIPSWVCDNGMCPPKSGSGKVEAKENLPAPVDVPAIQEKRRVVGNTGCPPDKNGLHGPNGNMCYVFTDGEAYTGKWTCSDPHNYALLTSVDQQVHVCHKVTP